MVRKWGAMYYLRKIGNFSLVALVIAMPSLAFGSAVVTSQEYVDMQDNLDEKLSNKLNGTATSGQKIGDLAAGGAAGQDQVMYPSAAAVKEYAVKIAQGTGTNNANVGKTLVVDSSGNLELGSIDALPSGSADAVLQYNGTNSAWESVTMDSTPTQSSVKPVTSGGVYDTLAGKQNNLGGNGNGGKVVTATDTAGTVGYTTIKTTVDTSADLITAGAVKTYADAKVSSASTVSSSDSSTAPNQQAVYDLVSGKQTKPASGVANGKVLTYTGSDADTQVSAAYVTVPVSSGAPSTNTPTAFAEVWVQ